MTLSTSAMLVALVWLVPAPPAPPAPLSPSAAPAPAGLADFQAVEIEVVTYNLQGLPAPVARPAWRSRRDAINRWLARGGFDLLAVQEAFDGVRGDLEPQPDLVPEQRDAGLGLWFAGKVQGVTEPFAYHYRARRGLERSKHKGVLGARVQLEGGAELWVYDTHVQAHARPLGARARAAQIRELLETIDQRPGPALLLGDMNLHRGYPPDEALEAAILAAGFVDVGSALGHGEEGTWLDSDLRLDRIYLRSDEITCLVPSSHEIVRDPLGTGEPLSDHWPVRARVRLEPCGMVSP